MLRVVEGDETATDGGTRPHIHGLAKAGFNVKNDLYDRARPSYPPEALRLIREALVDKDMLNVLEIGAGTGIFTRALLEHPSWSESIRALCAVEPSAGMREVFSQSAAAADARVSVHEGVFERTGAPDGWADLVVIAQAYHWCPDHEKALREFARVLKLGGIVVFIWNMEDRDKARWVAQLRDTYEQYEQGSPQYRLGLWRAVFSARAYSEHFVSPAEEHTIHRVVHATRTSVLDRVCSKSYIAVLPDDEQRTVRVEVEKILERGEDLVWLDREAGVLEYPYQTHVVIIMKK